MYVYTHIYTYIYTCVGGAVYAVSSRLIIDSAMQLLSNVAEDSGGAFYLSKGSSLSTKNSLLFEGNSAGAYGGTRMYVCISVLLP